MKTVLMSFNQKREEIINDDPFRENRAGTWSRDPDHGTHSRFEIRVIENI